MEKHKDYVLRARDFHKKEKALQILREKAEFRNPDEFYFGMERSRTVGGVHVGDLDRSEYTQEQIMLMKTQDKKYVEMKAQVERNRCDRLRATLHNLGEGPANKHIVFVDGEAQKKDFDASEYFDTPQDYLDRSFHRPRRSQLEAGPAPKLSKTQRRRKAAAYKELEQRERRRDELEGAALRMSVEKEAMGKGRKRRIQKASQNRAGAPVYRFKKERKK